MTPQEIWNSVKTKVGNDPRWWTTPAGMVAGLALTRALAPAKKRTAGVYALGGAAGAVAGMGAGTLLQAQGQKAEQEHLKGQASALLQQDPKTVLRQNKPDEAKAAARTALGMLYQNKPLGYFKGPLDPQEINAARLTLGQEQSRPGAKGVVPATVGGTLVAGAPPVNRLLSNWRRINRDAAAAEEARKMTKEVPLTAEERAARVLAQGADKRKVLKNVAFPPLAPPKGNPTGLAKWLTQTHRGRMLARGVLGTAAVTGAELGYKGYELATGTGGITKRFHEALGWQARAAHLESLQRFQQNTLNEDQKRALQEALDHAREKARERLGAARWSSWFTPVPLGG